VWAQGLRIIIGTNADAPPASAAESDEGDASGEMQTLMARSRQLQTQIGSLEAVNERRDKQLNQMVARLDGAMAMLEAVEGMCSQQRKVISCQKVAIDELKGDLGLKIEEDANGVVQVKSPQAASPKRPMAPHPTPSSTRGPATPHPTPSGAQGAAGAQSDSSPEADNAEIAANEQEMMALLAQAQQMQQMLQMLQAGGAGMGAEPVDSPSSGRSPGDLASMLSGLMAGLGSPGGGQEADEVEEDEDEEDSHEIPIDEDSEEAALSRLRGLEAEKQRFESLLSDSQQEHSDLLNKLNSMRTLMGSLGLSEDAFDDDLDDTEN
jgi:hypothetical protein